jgi:curli biogenesis system outer membrane secretion channel CsgG
MRATLFAFCFILGSCAISATAEITATPLLKEKPPQSYALLPFELRLSPSLKTLRVENALKYPNAAKVVTDAFETALLETGARIVERSQLDKALKEAAFANSGLTEANSIELGKLVSASTIVMGSVTEYHKGGFGKKETTVSVSVKAIDVESGTILWKGSGLFEGAKFGPKYSMEPEVAVPQLAKAFVQELIKKQ